MRRGKKQRTPQPNSLAGNEGHRRFPPPWSVEIAHEAERRRNIRASKGLGALGTRCFMRTNRTPDEWVDWCLARNRIDDELKKYYRACTTGELHRNYSRFQKSSTKNSFKKQSNSAAA
jgi:hypothetical protein